VDVPAPRLETPPPASPAPAPVDLLANAERAQTRGNYTEAAATLKQLVERGNARAMVKLGDLHLTGLGVERSDELALRLFRNAAELGNNEGQQRLGDMYVKGRGVPQNNLQAYIWLGTAARTGNGAAKTEQERIAHTLQAVEIKQAEKLIDNLVERLARAGKGD
jgi:TPR repeat protein